MRSSSVRWPRGTPRSACGPTWRSAWRRWWCALRGWEPFPSRLGLGFFLRGPDVHPTPFGSLASPRAFGGFGAGSTAFWVDPVRDLSYAFLSSGLLEDSYSVERHQRLADLVHAAIVR